MINHDLTPAETRAVYELAYGSGSTNKDIAKVMKVSHRTVEAHLGIAMQKLNVKN
jgi:DNA-binding CsgD family transcriptional regulator